DAATIERLKMPSPARPLPRSQRAGRKRTAAVPRQARLKVECASSSEVLVGQLVFSEDAAACAGGCLPMFGRPDTLPPSIERVLAPRGRGCSRWKFFETSPSSPD